jgi:hypothetical protein
MPLNKKRTTTITIKPIIGAKTSTIFYPSVSGRLP